MVREEVELGAVEQHLVDASAGYEQDVQVGGAVLEGDGRQDGQADVGHHGFE